MVDGHTLQVIRLELAALAQLDEIKTAAGLTDEEFGEHLLRLLMCGELFADCEVTADGFLIEVHGLSECGHLMLFRKRFRDGH